MKKLLSTVLALAMLLSLVVVPVSADSYDGSGALAGKTAAFTVEAGNDILYDNGGEQYVQFHIYVESMDAATPIRALSFKLDASDNLTLATKLKADNEDFWYDYPEAAALYKKQTDTDSTAFYSKFEYTPSSRYFAAAGSDEGKGIVERIEVMTICGKVTGVGDYTLNLTEVVAGDGEAPESVSQQFRREATGATVTVKAQPATNLLPMTMDKETVTVGEEFTVTLSHKEMTVSSFTASMNFKTDLLKVVDIETGAGYRALSDNAYLGTCVVSTVDEANNTGSIGIGAAASGDNTYAAAELLKVTFRALEAGETAIELEENSDGANGYIGDAQSLWFTVAGEQHTHSWTEMTTKEPTCTEQGEKTFLCDCGETYTEPVTPLGHDMIAMSAVAPTETTPGNSAYWHCARCLKYFSDANGNNEIAKDSWVIPPTSDAFTVYIEPSSKQVCPGQEVEIKIMAKDPPGIAGFAFDVVYDKEIFQVAQFVTVDEEGEETASYSKKGILLTDVTVNPTVEGVCSVAYAYQDDTTVSTTTHNRRLFSLKLKVKDSVALGETEIKIVPSEGAAGIWTNAKLENLSTKFESAFVDVGHTYDTAWKSDAVNHWHVCTNCGEQQPDTQAAHQFVMKDNGDGTHSKTCSICDYVADTAEHSSEVWKSDETGHWKVCGVCGVKFGAKAHTGSCKDNGDGTHGVTCTDCGYVVSKENHAPSGSWSSDSTGHWKLCADCGAKCGAAEHTLKYTANTDGTHSEVCTVCGYVVEGSTAAHSGAWKSDDEHHWKVCDTCGVEFARGEHKSTGGHVANCTAAATCDMCQKTYGAADADNHQWNDGIVTPSTATTQGKIRYTCQRDANHTKTENAPAYKDNMFRIELSTVERIYAGRTATMDVSLKNNPGIAGMALHFVYDDTYMKLTNMEEVGGMTGWVLNTDAASAAYSNTDNYYGDYTFLRLTFAVADNAPAGAIKVSIEYKVGGICNAARGTRDCAQSVGYVKVIDWLAGDVDGDYNVTPKDAVLLRQYLAKFTEAQTVIDKVAADVDGDGAITPKDAVLLVQYLAKYPDAKLVYVKGDKQ